MSGVKSDLFCLCEKVVGIAIERHFAYALNRHQFFRNNFGWIQQIKVEFMFVGFFNHSVEWTANSIF